MDEEKRREADDMEMSTSTALEKNKFEIRQEVRRETGEKKG